MEYRDLVNSYAISPRNVHTIPKTNTDPRWFYVRAKDDIILIESGRTNGRNSIIKGQRRLNPEEFDNMVDIYKRRKQNQSISAEATEVTRNQVYWFGILSDLNL